jgi:hypothetical protein
MSEEQPIFKVTDRRLFNADGTPREIERQEETKPEPPAPEAKEPLRASAASAQAAGETAQESAETPAAAQPAPTTAGDSGTGESAATAGSGRGVETEQFSADDEMEAEIPGVDDPASFINFLMSIASNAAASLGMMEHPVTGERRVDPELAKHWIDVLGMLHEKTRGNLDPQEQQIFEGLLADLRMQYVSLSGMRQPKSPRGFTGNDITGGR